MLYCRYCKQFLQDSSWGKNLESERHQTKDKVAGEEAREKWISQNPEKNEFDYITHKRQCEEGSDTYVPCDAAYLFYEKITKNDTSFLK